MSGHVIALCGGVGGAKLAFGLTQVLPSEDLTLVVNAGDDFVHLGLHICPDIDTVAYTLAGLSDRERGWGLAGETWNFMDCWNWAHRRASRRSPITTRSWPWARRAAPWRSCRTGGRRHDRC